MEVIAKPEGAEHTQERLGVIAARERNLDPIRGARPEDRIGDRIKNPSTDNLQRLQLAD